MGQTAEELRNEVAEKRADLSRDLESIGDRVSPERMVERRKAAVNQRVTDVKHRLMGAGDNVRSATSDRAHDASSSLADAAHGVTERTQRFAEGSPLAMGLVAFGIGMVASALLPSTDAESHLADRVEPTLRRAAEETGAAARDLVDEVKPALQDAGTQVMERAQEGAATIRDDARSVASEA